MNLNGEPCISIGVTGTRNELNAQQEKALSDLLEMYLNLETTGRRQVHHGCCIGADKTAHYIALGMLDVEIIGYPGYGVNQESPYRMKIDPAEFSRLRSARPYKERNSLIVAASQVLLAIPQYPENDRRSIRSGTWQTVRLARQKRVPVLVITATGAITGI